MLKKLLFITFISTCILCGCGQKAEEPATQQMYEMPEETLSENTSVYLRWYGRKYNILKYIKEYTDRNCTVDSSLLADVFGFKLKGQNDSPDLDPEYKMVIFENDNGDTIMFCEGTEELIINGTTYDSGIVIRKNENGNYDLKLLPVLQGLTEDQIEIQNIDDVIEYTVTKS